MRTFVDFKESDMGAFIGVSDMSIFSSLYYIIQDGMAVATSSRLLMVLAHLPLNLQQLCITLCSHTYMYCLVCCCPCEQSYR